MLLSVREERISRSRPVRNNCLRITVKPSCSGTTIWFVFFFICTLNADAAHWLFVFDYYYLVLVGQTQWIDRFMALFTRNSTRRRPDGGTNKLRKTLPHSLDNRRTRTHTRYTDAHDMYNCTTHSY